MRELEIANVAALLVPAAIVFASKLARYAIGNFADVGGVAPPLGLLAARHAAQARGEAGVIKQLVRTAG